MSYHTRHMTLLSMLCYKRKAGSVSEADFISRFIEPLNPYTDMYGNFYHEVLHKDGVTRPTTMFTAHTDSVHHTTGKQNITLDNNTGVVTLSADEEHPECLGADDATGIYIMLEMIKAGVPGLYAFFRAEEIGGLGSDHAFDHENWWKNCTKCVSFDRTSKKHSVITHQFNECCSETFGGAIAGHLAQESGIPYRTDDSGVFTDSANFMSEIAECTNISVGYINEHTARECQSLDVLDKLIPALISLDWEALPVKRTPVDEFDWLSGYQSFNQSNSSKLRDEIDEILTHDEFVIENDLDTFMTFIGQPPVYKDILNMITERCKSAGVQEFQLTAWYEHQLENS